MPYHGGNRLPAERASKLGHLEVLKSTLVQSIVQNFENPTVETGFPKVNWQPLPKLGQPLDLIFAVDGSLQIITDDSPPYKALAFVKTALMRLDQVAISKIDKVSPHPFEIRDLMSDSAMYHATVFPLRHVVIPNFSVYNAVRQIIYESLKDESLNSEPLETLKWIAYEKWSGAKKDLPGFQCPHCGFESATLYYDTEVSECSNCKNQIFISDMLGFHLEMVEDAAHDSVASAYMNIHETLLLFTGIRHFWESNRETLKRCLFIKDGPLQIRAQYSKLVAPIRRFFEYALKSGIPICVIGQEKSGAFVDNLNLIGRLEADSKLFIPNHSYICEEIQQRPASGAPYGKDTNYGAKVFLIVNERNRLVINVPVSKSMGSFITNPLPNDLIGFDRILATIPNFLSSRYENGLLPIELANSIASLSTYPSAKVLRMFSDQAIK
jgi:hypothetical protein